jgi:hypothetical protein
MTPAPSLSELKRQAINAETAWQEARTRVLKHLRQGEVLLDCSYCARACIAPSEPYGQLWFCSCSPRNGQKVIRPAA